ncbi:MAG: hypothetical protein ACRC6X_07360 [Culicoidibacterales bacterium]
MVTLNGAARVDCKGENTNFPTMPKEFRKLTVKPLLCNKKFSRGDVMRSVVKAGVLLTTL